MVMDLGRAIIFLGLRGRATEELTAGQKPESLRGGFKGLTPRMLASIPAEVMPAQIRDGLVTIEGAVRVPSAIAEEAFAQLRSDTPVVEAQVGAEFRTLTPELRTFGEVVRVMGDALSRKGRSGGSVLSTNPGVPVGLATFHVSPKVAEGRGVDV